MPRGRFWFGPGFWKGGPGPGRGFRGYPPCWWLGPVGYPLVEPGTEARFLRQEADALRRELEAVEKRLGQLQGQGNAEA